MPKIKTLQSHAGIEGTPKSLYSYPYYKSFGLPKWSENITHLVYGDDTTIFSNAVKFPIESLMKIL
ncbi:hypothetical protein H5410_057829 [Solanum commersonii]|uniref:Uncharacterized protein n=1 Tax=Solanum commersonii TaxID=4109 RepID=A0A9J5WR47_SOLCO|nr:hypothetical protein H5410_057829 [Solanum commersonii]